MLKTHIFSLFKNKKSFLKSILKIIFKKCKPKKFLTIVKNLKIWLYISFLFFLDFFNFLFIILVTYNIIIKIMRKIITYILIFTFLVLDVKVMNADFFEDTLELKTQEFQIKLNFYKLKNYHIRNKKYQRQYVLLKKINPLIKEAIIKKYKNQEFSYYKSNALVRHYSNFIYYANKYFESIKATEQFWNTPELKYAIYKNFVDMKSSYYKFANLLK